MKTDDKHQKPPLKGIQFVTDAQGKKTAVQISLEEWGDIWEDIYDVLVSEARESEPTVSWDKLKQEKGRDTRSSKVL